MENLVPLPFFKLDSSMEILERSEEAAALFGREADFLTLVDAGSRRKADQLLKTEPSVRGAELNMISGGGEVLLCSVYFSWHQAECACALVPVSDSYANVSSQLTGIQARLNETNFELFEKTEELERVLYRANKFSGPFIDITSTLGLIPLFGDLSPVKLAAIQENVIKRTYAAQPDRILLDFTGVGTIESETVPVLCSLIHTFKQMGIDIVLIGLRPSHARALAPHKRELKVEVKHSAKRVIEEWILSK
ncbi:STAS domain-containing protein [Alkalicoccus urumqiensis]|uniref:STAS domain-containing protein n=1 Tax=Alkalicoccus urumqiensis TaxID=1548213 RepID=A0A2P6MDS1_ALKUR|nr:STAS domain-containing protein [Alkalicoccus urumqiensis]PRO64435.1 hypothetical protein C6I21_14635 [Alkalicoccus urumqiensis]